MNNKKYYKMYWKRILGYDFNSEYTIYKYLCGEVKWREKRKIPVNKKFKLYSEWKDYVELFYKRKELCEIKEFYRYLNCKKRVLCASNKFNNSFISPFVIALTAGSIVPILLKLQLPNINYKEITNNISHITLFQKIIVLVILLIIALFVFILLLALVVLPFVFFLISSFSEVSDYKLKIDFYEDYMEIISQIIEKEIQSES